MSKTYARFLELGTLKNRPRRNRGKVTTERQDCFFALTARRNPRLSHPELQRQLLQATGVTVSALRVPELSRQNKVNRLNWYLEHENWTIEDWKNVLFPYETRIGLRSGYRRVHSLRGRGRQARLRVPRPIRKYKGGTVMFWDGIMICEKNPLIPIRPSLTGFRYVDLVLQSVVRLWRGAFGHFFLFMLDNAPPHSSRVAKKFFETGVTVFEWSSCSPDLNPIEHLWDKMKRKIRARQNNLAKAEQLIKAEELANFTEEISNLIECIPQRIQACINARGGNADY